MAASLCQKAESYALSIATMRSRIWEANSLAVYSRENILGNQHPVLTNIKSWSGPKPATPVIISAKPGYTASTRNLRLQEERDGPCSLP